MVFKLPAHGPKCITHGDIGIFMGMPFMMFMLRDELAPRDSYLDTNFINTPLMAMFVGQLDDHAAVNDLGDEFLEALR